jgi:DNA repair protein RecN (Recombination protein N)
MLCNLVVENYALISKLDIEFRKGLTIITGETGAGKSILLGALSLILGKRADTNILYDKEKKCIVEGTFDVKPYDLHGFFDENSIDYDDQTVVRREVSAAGKSRAFINDTPVNLEKLTEFGLKLIDIHSQHQNLNLTDSIFQMKVLDSFARSQNQLKEYKEYFNAFRRIEHEYRQLSEEAVQSKSDLDYVQFQLNQLEEAHLKEGEQEELEMEQEKLNHAEEIKIGLTTALTLLQQENDSVLHQLKECYSSLSRINKFLHGHDQLSTRLDSAYIELKDIAEEIDNLNNQIHFDPERLAVVNDRLNIIYSLEKKHRVNHLDELLDLLKGFREKINAITSYDLQLEAFQKKLKTAEDDVQKSASKLSGIRRNAIPAFEKNITGMLKEVGIPNAGFSINFEPAHEFTASGADKILFMFTANKNMPLQDIARVASGGEISRLMLCIKSLMVDSIGLPTIIFDEIDTGVSGDIAERVGNIINRMSEKMQIINITHLPQVASKGQYHYLVYKTDEGKSTVTRMKLLTSEERHREIAKMLSGEEITPAALENARALLGN